MRASHHLAVLTLAQTARECLTVRAYREATDEAAQRRSDAKTALHAVWLVNSGWPFGAGSGLQRAYLSLTDETPTDRILATLDEAITDLRDSL